MSYIIHYFWLFYNVFTMFSNLCKNMSKKLTKTNKFHTKTTERPFLLNLYSFFIQEYTAPCKYALMSSFCSSVILWTSRISEGGKSAIDGISYLLLPNNYSTANSGITVNLQHNTLKFNKEYISWLRQNAYVISAGICADTYPKI